MLVPDNIYRRIPLLWMVLGILFLFLGFSVGPSYTLFPAYLGLGFLCIGRSLWIYQARWQYFRKNELKTMHTTQIIDRSKIDEKPEK